MSGPVPLSYSKLDQQDKPIFCPHIMSDLSQPLHIKVCKHTDLNV